MVRHYRIGGDGTLTPIDTSRLYNPLDDVGYQQLKPGDRVTVAGGLDRHFFTTGRLRADTVTSLVEDPSTAE